jgi:hypothetical protein
LGREHHLEVIAPAYTFQNSDQTAKTVGDTLCRSALICERYVPTDTTLPEKQSGTKRTKINNINE